MSNDSGRDFVALCYEVFLGREVDAMEVVEERGAWPVDQVLESFLRSDEFGQNVHQRLKQGHSFPAGSYSSPLRIHHRLWVVDRLPINDDSKRDVLASASWRALLKCLVADEQLMALSAFSSLADVPQEELADPEDGEDAFEAPAEPFELGQHKPIFRDPLTLWGG